MEKKTINTVAKRKPSHNHNNNHKEQLPSCCMQKEKEEKSTSCCCHNEEKPHEPKHVEEACCCNHDHEASEGGCCGNEHNFDDKKQRNKGLVLLLVSLVCLIISFINPLHDYGKVFMLLDFAWVAIVICGFPIYKSAFKSIAKKKITSALLISIAMTASIIMGIITAFGGGESDHESYFFVAGEVSFLMALGGMIESITVGKSRSAIQSLISIKPSTAYLKIQNTYQETDVKQINIDDIVLIKPNETVSVDGVVTLGSGAVNEANITGESKPSDKVVGDNVYAGTINLNSAIEVRVTKLSHETTLSKLIDYVKNAEKNKAPIVQLADKWAGYLVPAACLISLFVFLLSMFAFQIGALASINRAITILVVVCPCALALATPIAISAGIGNAGRRGILIKSGIALEALAKVDTVAFDKTGTLTSGQLRVHGVYCNEIDEKTLIYYAASAEMQSEHPIAKAITEYANGNLTTPQSTKSIGGTGLVAVVDNKEIKLIKLSSIKEEEYNGWYDAKNNKNTVTAVIIDGKLQGIIEISDTIREDAFDSVARLNEMNFDTVMLTGDNEAAALYVKDKLKLKNYFSNLLPEDKVKRIEELKSDGKKVLMVGDGVNDAPALATSDCSLSMGAMGNSVAIETADISLMDSKLSKIPRLIGLAKRTLMTIRINIIMSISINIAAVVLGSLGYLNVVAGALIHNIGSVLVSLNAALLLLYK